jgi:hypothetical protein
VTRISVLIAGLLLVGCARPPAASVAPVQPTEPPYFRDATAEAGIDFSYHNGEEADHYTLLETLGGGVAAFDFDGDGRLDLFLPGGGGFGDGPTVTGRPSRLDRNLGDGKFADVTDAAGLGAATRYTHGAAVGDYDRDGWPDLLVTGWGGAVLYHNEPDGHGGRRFADATARAGLTLDGWCTSAAWGDLDGDGWPDLYVCRYADWSFANHPACTGYGRDVRRDVCPPKRFRGLPHRLFHNEQGKLRDVSQSAGLRDDGKGLGVLMADVDGDQKPDLYVANDTDDNFLYLNRSRPGAIRLEEVGLARGVARDDGGTPNGSMGVDAADYDERGLASLWVTNYENEMHGLYRNLGGGPFLFATLTSGIAAIGRTYVGFGTGFLDLDHDGREDLIVSNGHVIRHAYNLRQRPVLLRNRGGGRFEEVTRAGGSYFHAEHRGRGLALADLNNDGRTDVVVSHANEPVRLLMHDRPTGRAWVGVELVGAGNADVTGARLTLEAGGRRLTRFAKSGVGYLSACDRRVVFGLGEAARADRLTVAWPSGRVQEWAGGDLEPGRYRRLREDPAAGR